MNASSVSRRLKNHLVDQLAAGVVPQLRFHIERGPPFTGLASSHHCSLPGLLFKRSCWNVPTWRWLETGVPVTADATYYFLLVQMNGKAVATNAR
jgi:hypothetical protein